ncbi:MAG: ADP-ribosylglycohydrolase family protein [Spirochaetia bacterium]
MAKDILDAVYGCLIGGAIGDAMGAPTEGMLYTEIREKYGKVNSLLPHTVSYTNGKPGNFTDDTTLRHYLCYAIAQKGGRITPDDFAKVWIEKVNTARLWASELIVRERIRWGINPWEAGLGAIPAGCGPMYIAPVGIINAADPAQAFQDGFNIASVNQLGENRDFAAAFAASVAAAFSPGATVERVIATMSEYGPDIVRRAMELTLDLAMSCGDMEEFTHRFYETMLDWTWSLPPGKWNKNKFFSGNSREFVPVVFAILHFHGSEPNRAIIEGANFGRDCDTIASLVGNIVGAIHGADSLKSEWIDTVETANTDFYAELEGDPAADIRSMAVRMVHALEQTKTAYEKRVHALAEVLGSHLDGQKEKR